MCSSDLAERVYLNEDGITLKELAADSERMVESFRSGRKLYLVVRNEKASENYTTDVLAKIFAEEARGLYDVREAIIGHIQQGGNPTAFDRLMATKLVHYALGLLADDLDQGTRAAVYVGLVQGQLSSHPLERMHEELDLDKRRPKSQWWMGMRGSIGLVNDNTGLVSVDSLSAFIPDAE